LVEISKCRKCASCCRFCIFLDLNKDTRLFSCLIYNNKHRIPIIYDDIKRFINYPEKDEYSEFLERLVRIINEPNVLCDRFKCHDFTSKFKKSKLSERISFYLKYERKDILQARKLIPNFNTLVEILNA